MMSDECFKRRRREMRKPGAKPQVTSEMNVSSERAQCLQVHVLSRAFSAINRSRSILGRCPRLSHFAPLALILF